MADDDENYLCEVLEKRKKELQEDLCKKKIQRLHRKKDTLAKLVVQRKQIQNLNRQIAEIEPTVDRLYNPAYNLKDNEIVGYLCYLLKMKDFFERECATKQQMIKDKGRQIKELERRKADAIAEMCKRAKNAPKKPNQFKRLENMSNKMEQIQQRISTIRQENAEICKEIASMKKFQDQFKTFEDSYRRRIKKLKQEELDALKRAVSAYEERDADENEANTYRTQRSRALQTARVARNQLCQLMEKKKLNEAFAEMQDIARIDPRVAELNVLIEKGITGNEANLERNQNLQTAISAAAGEEVTDKMKENFDKDIEDIDKMMTYLDEQNFKINFLEEKIKEEQQDIDNLTKDMTSRDRKMVKKIKENEDIAEKKKEEADEAAERANKVKEEVDILIQYMQSLHKKLFPEEDILIDQRNAIDNMLKIEAKILDLVFVLEAKNMDGLRK